MIFAPSNVEEFLYTPGRYFEIPEFQRPYSWQVSNVREFLSDLDECVRKDKKHYFGTVVIVKETDDINSSAIIDGQQRVTTSLLMIAAIFHLVSQKPELSGKMTAEDIKEKYLVNRNESNRIKLRTVTTDNTILQRIFDVEGDGEKLSQDEKQNNLFRAYSEFKDYFSAQTNLDKYITALRHFEIVTIALDSRDDNPQRVFESINSTGKPLTDGDKIRNFALMLNNNATRQHVYKNYWQRIEKSLTSVGKDNITNFFRSYIISKRQAIIKEDSVYPEFKKLFAANIDERQSLEDVNMFYGDITKVLEYYLLCRFEQDPDSKYSSVKGVVFKMRYIQTELYIPFAITVLSYYDSGNLTEKQLADVFKLIEVYFSRRIVCNINTTSVDRFLASLHKDVLAHQKENPETDYVEVMKYLFLSRTGPTRMPNDSEFTMAIVNNYTYNQRTAHVNYILASVDDQTKESETLRQMADGRVKLSIEHVMPQTLSDAWKKELGIDEKGPEYVDGLHERYLHTLANLTLTGYNTEYSNHAFGEKKTMQDGFEQSQLRINKWIADKEKWGEEALKARQQWWIESLEKVWPIPSTGYKPVTPDTTVYLLDELDLKGSGIKSVSIFGEALSVSTWAEALDTIAEKFCDKFSNFFDVVTDDEFLSRFIKTDQSAFNASYEILESGYFIDTGINTNRKLRLIQALATAFGASRNDLVAELTTPLGNSEN